MVADTQEISSIPGKAPSLKARAWAWQEGPRGLGLTKSLSLRSKIFLPESNSHHPSKWTSLNLISPLSKSQTHMFNCLPATIVMSQQPSHFKKQTPPPPKKNPLTFPNTPALSQCSKCHQYNLRNRNFGVILKTSLSFIFPHPTYHRGHPPPPSKCLRLIHFSPLAPSILTWTLATILDLNPIFFLCTLQQVPAWQQGHCLENAILLLKTHQRQAALFQ